MGKRVFIVLLGLLLAAAHLPAQAPTSKIFGTIPAIGRANFPFTSLYMNFPLDQDVVARAYEKMGDIDKAIEAYRKLITFDPKSQDRRMHNPVYHYRLAKLYDAKGFREQAAAEYKKLLDFWKDADPGIPELIDAKVRLAALK
jgi:tetratricopeptide (TPR) repeat protein